jgi:Spy/CpxP family protein refolding chaperone
MLSRQYVFTVAIGALLAFALPAMGQGKGKGRGHGGGPGPAAPEMGGPGMGPDGGGEGRLRHELMASLYPIELVRARMIDIKLTDEQVEKLRKLVSDVRTEVEQLEWDLQRQGIKLVELVRKGATKEEIYAHLDLMFANENKIKKKQLGLLIVVRDVLTAKQRAQLDKYKADMEKERERWRQSGPGHGPGPGGPGAMPPGPPPGGPGMGPPPGAPMGPPPGGPQTGF